MDDKIIQVILDDIKDIKQDVKSLLAVKYQLFGIATGVAFIVTLLWDIVLK